MIHLSIDGYSLEIKDELNKKLFEETETRTQKCGCDECKSFEIACEFISKEVKDFFESMGVDISKPTELMHCYDENGKSLYCGFYNIVGKILSGESCYKLNGKQDETEVYSIKYVNLTEDYKIGFSDGDDFIINGKNFPHLVVEFEGWFKNRKD